MSGVRDTTLETIRDEAERLFKRVCKNGTLTTVQYVLFDIIGYMQRSHFGVPEEMNHGILETHLLETIKTTSGDEEE